MESRANSVRREQGMNNQKLGSFALCAMLFALCVSAEAQQAERKSHGY
jgi:hypothetical protein